MPVPPKPPSLSTPTTAAATALPLRLHPLDLYTPLLLPLSLLLLLLLLPPLPSSSSELATVAVVKGIGRGWRSGQGAVSLDGVSSFTALSSPQAQAPSCFPRTLIPTLRAAAPAGLALGPPSAIPVAWRGDAGKPNAVDINLSSGIGHGDADGGAGLHQELGAILQPQLLRWPDGENLRARVDPPVPRMPPPRPPQRARVSGSRRQNRSGRSAARPPRVAPTGTGWPPVRHSLEGGHLLPVHLRTGRRRGKRRRWLLHDRVRGPWPLVPPPRCRCHHHHAGCHHHRRARSSRS